MKQETIGSKGTVSGFRPLIGAERWHRDDFTAEMLSGGWRPLLVRELPHYGDEISEGPSDSDFAAQRLGQLNVAADGRQVHQRTNRPLPPPAVETFEAHGHIWYKHTPGDDAPIEPDTSCHVIYKNDCTSNSVFALSWKREKDMPISGYRFPDYPVVHTTLQQEQSFADRLTDLHVIAEKAALQLELRDMKQRLTSIYNGWVHLPPETVAECIADVASVLYPTDASRCDAAFEVWKQNELGDSSIAGWKTKAAWDAAWKAAK